MNNNEWKALIKQIDDYTKAHVKKSRYEHSVRVAEMCSILCQQYGLDADSGYLAGIGHDMCKDMEEKEMRETSLRDGNPITPFEDKKWSLLHGRAAAVLMKEKFGITDACVLEAVANHTSGIYGMCDLTKCLFLADKIEPGRPQSTEEYRNRYLTLSLNEFTASVVIENYEYITAKGYDVYPGTDKMVEYFKQFMESDK